MANTKRNAKDSTTKAATRDRKGNAGMQNLIPLTQRDPEQAKAIRVQGAKAKGAKAAQRRTIREIYRELLAAQMPEKVTAEAVQEYAQTAGKSEITGYDAVAIAQLIEAQKGSTRAAEFVRDSVGDKPGEKVEMSGQMTDADRRLLAAACKRLGIDIE